jgi:hypothetical protein
MLRSRYALAATSLALGLAVSACGSSQSGTTPAASTQGGYGAQGGAGQNGGQDGGPGGSGKVAAVTGSTAQVQGQSGQVAVTWTGKTTFTQQVATAASALKVGDCVVAMPSTTGSSGSSGSSSSSGSSTVAAATVRITAPVKGSCTTGFGGQRPGGGTPPQGEGQNPPQGAAGGARGVGFGAFGKVTAVAGSGFTVASARPDASTSSSTTTPTTTSVSVTTTSSTTWTRTATATAKDVKIGRCVVSRGNADSTGAIAAQSITISQPVNGQCSTGFGGGGRGGFGNGGSTGSSQGGEDQTS